MPLPTLDEVVDAIRASWSAETCDLMLAEVLLCDGSRQGFHYCNVLPDGTEIDLTLDQFDPDETVQEGRRVVRPPGRPRRCRAQYDALRDRVLAHLGGVRPDALPR